MGKNRENRENGEKCRTDEKIRKIYLILNKQFNKDKSFII